LLKYAIFSDIHGNLPALEAALADAKGQGADMHLFIGDYHSYFPFWLNDTLELIRSVEGAIVISGNNEGYLVNMRSENPDGWVYDQFIPIYSNYRALTLENLDYITGLPDSYTIRDKGGEIFLAHSSPIFYRSPKIYAFHSSSFREKMGKEPFSHEDYLEYVRASLLANPGAMGEARALPVGVYLFGHNHLQFYAEVEGRLFVNPGSCGAACDCDPTAAYTILEYCNDGAYGGGRGERRFAKHHYGDGGNDDGVGGGGGGSGGDDGSGDGAWRVTERRVVYDVEYAAGALRKSAFAESSPIWAGVIERCLLTGKDYFGPFVRHIVQTGRKYGHTSMPMPNDVFAYAASTWSPEKLYM